MTVDHISSLYPTLHREIKRPIYQPKHEHTLAIFSPAKALLREPPNDSFDIDLIRTPHYLIPIGADDTRAVRFEEGVSTLPLLPDDDQVAQVGVRDDALDQQRVERRQP